jgi:hypothetical protein
VKRIGEVEIDAARALCAAALPGPWRSCGADRGGCVCRLVWSIPADVTVATASVDYEPGRQDVDFIAAARTLVPQLLDEVTERRAADLDADDLRSIADTVTELRANAADWDPGEAEDAIRPLLKILAAHGVTP